MFTNSIVNAPSITTIIKDTTSDEQSLYKIVKPKRTEGPSKKCNDMIASSLMDTKVERIDGKVLYSLQPIVSDKLDDDNEDEDYDVDLRNPVVKFPDLIRDNHRALRSIINLENKNDFREMYYQVSSVLNKFPDLIENYPEFSSQLNEYEDKYRELQHEINGLESEIKQRKGYINSSSSGSDMTIDDYIELEKAKIAELENQINTKHK
ncbi:hypothetical protein SBY92_002245 [Candida maltosa Xu316]